MQMFKGWTIGVFAAGLLFLGGVSCSVYTQTQAPLKEPTQKVYEISDIVQDVYLPDTLGSNDDYLVLIKTINDLRPEQTLRLHIAGYGGQVDTLVHIINAIENSKGTVDTIVEGPVYSAHAVLATVGKHMYVSSRSLFMFHAPAIKLGEEYVLPSVVCQAVTGLDRGQSARQKCEDSMKYNKAIFDSIAAKYVFKHLTKQQIKDYNNGRDVYLTSDEMLK